MLIHLKPSFLSQYHLKTNKKTVNRFIKIITRNANEINHQILLILLLLFIDIGLVSKVILQGYIDIL